MKTRDFETGAKNVREFPVAKLTEALVEIYRGNPFIESLGPILDDEGAINAMLNVPFVGTNQHSRIAIVRGHELMRFLNICIPMARNIDLFHRIHILLRYGYVGRPQTRQEFVNWIQKPLELEKQKGSEFRLSRSAADTQRSGTAFAFSVIGPSGTGKTSGILNTFKGVPLVQYHEELNVYQISRLVVTCPEDGRIKGLLFRIIDAFDVVLGENFSKDTRKFTTEGLIIFVAQMCRLYNVGMIVIDEFNNLTAASTKTNEVNFIINFLVDLMEVVHVPLVIVGNDSCRQFIGAQLRSAKRLSGLGDMDWGFLDDQPLVVQTQAAQDGTNSPEQAASQTTMLPSEFEEFVSTFLSFQLTDQKATYQELGATLLDETGGMHDLIIKKMILAQLEALRTGVPKVTVKLLRRVCQREFGMFKKLLVAIKNKDLGALENYSDLKPHFETRASFMVSGMPSLDTTRRIQDAVRAKQAEQGDVVERVTLALIATGRPEDTARNIATTIVAEHPAVQVDEALKLVFEGFEPAKPPRPKKAGTSSTQKPEPAVSHLDEDDLRRIVFSRANDTSAYESLVDAGIVWKSFALDLLTVQ